MIAGKQYEASHIQEWTHKICDTINSRVKELNMRRFKHVVQVVIVQQTGAGCRYIARCRWDAETDAQVSNYFTNESIVCVVTVFAVYVY
ncbi:Dynein light chain Tctex-type protein 2B [Pseudolycoriella hygida]|uniref:Dynein light chain Tctex-type protein 2B n=1 Tax=Pseudolycoriella hygida TaxID=35572 RepID=A0A9Q0RX24_9DIPT|nr:Dynein light chain Tctex-type protein 2B [Pseudolycoriella hygida]